MKKMVFVAGGRRLAFENPVEVFVAASKTEVVDSLKAVSRGLRHGLYAAGFVSYEAASAFDDVLDVHAPSALPLSWFGLYRKPVRRRAEAVGDFRVGPWRPAVAKTEYNRCISAIRRLISAGDVYQVNYTFPLTARFQGSAQAWFECLNAAQPADHCVFAQSGRFSIVSVSPELFFKLRAGRLVTRPMKGTRARQARPAADRRAAAELLASPKERAENVMIVDLLRNDMSRISRPGTVKVSRLYAVEAYPTVWQLTSTVVSRTAASAPEVLGALFPSGSVTGAPKIRAMQIIRDLERTPRGVYCGAIGWMAPDGAAEFNVAIRTAVVDHECRLAHYHVGGGITHDSVAADEYAECLAKAVVLQRVGRACCPIALRPRGTVKRRRQ